jgi:hypothetical protein
MKIQSTAYFIPDPQPSGQVFVDLIEHRVNGGKVDQKRTYVWQLCLVYELPHTIQNTIGRYSLTIASHRVEEVQLWDYWRVRPRQMSLVLNTCA